MISNTFSSPTALVINMSAQKQEGRQPSSGNTTPTTIHNLYATDSHFFPSYAVPFRPYATIHVRRGQRSDSSSQRDSSRLNSIVNSPFKRISRVEGMIQEQKQALLQDGEPDSTTRHPSLKPHFKIRTNKQPTKPYHAVQESLKRVLHCQNLSLQYSAQPQPASAFQQEKNSWGNSFQEIFKNRQKLNRKSPRKKIEASLLDMLNRISDLPPQRYKSRAFDYSSKTNAFSHH